MNKLTYSNVSTLSEYKQFHREKNSLWLKIKFNRNKQQNLQIIKVIEEQLGKLTHLTDLALNISKHSILTTEGYRILSKAILNLNQLKKLSIKINSYCFLENQGLNILQDMFNHLPELAYLKLEIFERNYITTEAVQEFVDSLSKNKQLTTLNLHFEDLQSSSTNEGNISTWSELQNLTNLNKLKIYLATHSYSYSDLIELFEHIAHLKQLKNLHLIFEGPFKQYTSLLDQLFPQIGKMIELRSLKMNYLNYEKIILNESQRKIIVANLNNLKSLEKLNLYYLEQVLLNDSFVEYTNLIKNMKNLKTISWNIGNQQVKSTQQLNCLNQSLLELNNLFSLELILSLGDGQFQRIFFEDLAVSFSQMHNLHILKLEFKEQISEVGCNILGESFMHLQRLEKFDLCVQLPKKVRTQLLYCIRKLRNLKVLEIKADEADEKQSNDLIDSISQLSQLERLHQINNYDIYDSDLGIEKLDLLSNIFKNVRKLKYLKCGFKIYSHNYKEIWSSLGSCFRNLSNLENLELDLNFCNKPTYYYNLYWLNHLTNIKKIKITFLGYRVNIFGYPYANLIKLEHCQIFYHQKVKVEQLLLDLDALSYYPIRELGLSFSILKEREKCQYLLENAFSKLGSLERLSITKRDPRHMMEYVHGIKHLKKLKSLKFESLIPRKQTLTFEDIEEFGLSLKYLKNLEVLNVRFTSGTILCNERDLLQLNSLKSLGHLKHFSFSFVHQIDDCFVSKNIEFRSACYLELPQQNPKNLKDQEINSNQSLDVANDSNPSKKSDVQMQDKHNIQELSQHEIKNEDNLKVFPQEFNPTELKLDLLLDSGEKQKILTSNEFDFQNQEYLNKLDISCKFNQKRLVKLELIQPLRDLTSESKLLYLALKLNNLILNKEQINYLARNFKYLTNLQYLEFSTVFCQNHYDVLLDSFKYLSNLNQLKFKANISDNGAISLGNSIQSMRKLQISHLQFRKKSTIELKGICSILNGLKHTTRLKELYLVLNQKKFIVGDMEIPLSECISNLKHLLLLQFTSRKHHIHSKCMRNFITSAGSLALLNTLYLDVNRMNLFDQDMLDELIKVINKSTVLNQQNISIYLDTNKSINISKDLATLLNKTLNSQLAITIADDSEIIVKQTNLLFSFRSLTKDNLNISFLEYLNENIQVFFSVSGYQMLKNITMCAARKIKVSFFNLTTVEDMASLCGFMTKIPNMLDLDMKVHDISNVLGVEETTKRISQILPKLKALRFLNLILLTNNWYQFSNENRLMIMYSAFKNIKYLITLRCLCNFTN